MTSYHKNPLNELDKEQTKHLLPRQPIDFENIIQAVNKIVVNNGSEEVLNERFHLRRFES